MKNTTFINITLKRKGIFWLFLILSVAIKIQAANISCAATGNWNAGATWVGGVVPGAGDNVTISGNFLVTVNANASCNSLTILGLAAGSGTSRLTIAAGNTLTVTGGIIIQPGTSGTSPYFNARLTNNGTLMIGTNLTVDASNSSQWGYGYFDQGAGSTSIGGNILAVGFSTTQTANITFTGAGTINMNGANSIVSLNAYSITDLGTFAGVINMNGTSSALNVAANGTLTLGSGSANVNLSGSISNAGTFNAGNSTVTYQSNGSQTIAALNYYNLTSTGSGARILANTGTIGVGRTFTIGTNSYTNTGSTINFNGTGAQTVPAFNYNNLTISGAHTTNNVTVSSTGTVNIAGALANSSTYSTGALVTTGSTINFTGGAAQTIITFPYYNLNVTKTAGTTASTVNNNNVSISGNCTVYSGILSVGTGGTVVGQIAEYTFSGNAGSSILEVKNGARLNLLGTSAFPSSFPTSWFNVILNDNSDLEYSSVGAQTVVAYQYGNLICSGAAGTRTLASSGNIKVAGAFTPNAGTINYTIAGSTIEYNGTAPQTISPFNYHNLSVTNAGTNITLSGTAGVAGTFTATSSSFANNTGTIDYNASGAQTVTSFNYFNLTLSGNRTSNNVTLAAPMLIGVAGALANTTVFSTGAIVNTGSTIVYNGTGAQTVIDFPYNNLSVNKTAGVASLGANLTTTNLKGNLSVLAGTLATNSFTITGSTTKTISVSNPGILDISGTTPTFPTGFTTVNLAPASYVIYSSNGAQTIAAHNYGNLTSTSTGARTLASSGTIGVQTNFASGTNAYTVTGSTVEFNGTATQSLTGGLGSTTYPFNNFSINNSGTNLTDGLALGANTTVNGVVNMMNGYLNLNAQTLIVANAATGAMLRTNGVILSENTSNLGKVQWNIGTTTGAHVFPFGKTLADYIPFTFNLTSGNASNITVSTYATSAANTPLPTLPVAVTGIDQQGATDASNAVVDRFWQVDASTGVARTATLTFSFASTEMPSSIITPKVQKWNGTSWDAALTGQTNNATSVTVPGVTAFSAFAIYDNTPPTAGFLANTTSACAGASIQFNDTSLYNPTSWNWTFNGGNPGSSTIQNPVVTYTAAGTYTVTLQATNNYGSNSVTKTGYITINATPSTPAPSSNGPVCDGAALNLSSNVSGVTYVWTGPNGFSSTQQNPSLPTVTSADAGTYSLTVTQNGCTSGMGTVSVTVTPNPTVTVNNATICAGQTATLTATGATSFSWSSGGNSAVETVNPTNTTSYTVTGTDNGCSANAIATVTVNQIPNVTVNNPTICSGQTATLTANGATNYSWSSGGSSATENVNPTSTTSYTVTGTSNGCSADAIATVTVNQNPSVSVNNATICSGQTATLTANGATNYSWSSGGSSATENVNPTSTISYTVTGTSNGCSADAVATVNVNQNPNVTANASQTSVCNGGSVTLTGGGANTYTWSSGVSDGVSFPPSSTQTYTVTGTDNNNCSNTAMVTVTVNSLPSVNANASATTVCLGDSVILSGGGASTYAWSNGVNDGMYYTPSATQNYTVTGTDNNGCQGTDTITVIVDNCTTGLTALNKTQLKVYPNPFTNEINVVSDHSLGTVLVYNAIGEKVMAVTTKETETKLNLADLKAGVYILRVQHSSMRLIKE